MEGTLARLGIIIENGQARRSLDELDTSMNKTVSRAEMLDRALKGMLGAISAGVVIKKFVDESTQAQYAQAQLEAAVGSTGMAAMRSVEQLQSLASELQGLSTYSDEAIQGAESLLLTFTKIRGDVFDDATHAVVDLATRMNGDLQGAALQVGKALQDPEKGLTALARSGVSFSESQKEVIKDLYETGEVAKAQTMILRELENEFGGSAKAARDTLGGALTGLSNDFGELFEVTKEDSKPAIDAVNDLASSIQHLKEVLDEGKFLARTIENVAGFLDFLVKFKAITSEIDRFRENVAGNIGSSIGEMVNPLDALGESIGRIRGLFAEDIPVSNFQSVADIIDRARKAQQSLNSETKDGEKEARQLADANRDRVIQAEQALALTREEGAAAQRLAIEFKAANDARKARSQSREAAIGGDTFDLKGTLESIDAAKKLALAVVDVTQAEDDLHARFRQYYADAASARDVTEKQTRLTKDATQSWYGYAATVGQDAVQANARIRREIEDANAEMREQERIIDGLSATIRGEMVDAIEYFASQGEFTFRAFFDVVGQMARNLVHDIEGPLSEMLKKIEDGVATAETKAAAHAAQVLQYGAIGVASGVQGYGIGAKNADMRVGALGGAVSGAAIGSVAGPVGIAVGALAGMVGGILGSAKAAKENEAANEALTASYYLNVDAIQQLVNGADPLALAIGQVNAQFISLRQQLGKPPDIDNKGGDYLRAAYAYELNKLNELEQQRIDQLREEAAELAAQKNADFKDGNAVLALRVAGLDAEADALQSTLEINKEYSDALETGIDPVEALLRSTLRLQLAEQKLAEDREKESERVLRSITGSIIRSNYFVDPRGAAVEELNERQRQRVADATTELEKFAAETENAAERLAFFASRAEADRRTGEGTISAILGFFGDGRAAEDFNRGARQRQQSHDARGESPFNQRMIEFSHEVENSFVIMTRAIEDGTAAINKQRDADLAEVRQMQDFENTRHEREMARLGELVNAEKQRASSEIAAVRERTKMQTDALRAQELYQRETISLLEKSVQTAEQIVEGINDFLDNLKLAPNSPLSPMDRQAEAERQYSELLTRANAGDAEAAMKLTGAASNYWNETDSFYGSTPAGIEIFNRIQSELAGVRDRFGESVPTDVKTLEAAKQAVEGIQSQIEAIEASAEREVEAIQKQSDTTLAGLQAQMDAEDARHQEALDWFEKEVKAINEGADKQIEQLKIDEQLKHDERVKALDFYKEFSKFYTDSAAFWSMVTEGYSNQSQYAPVPFSPVPIQAGNMASVQPTEAEQQQLGATNRTTVEITALRTEVASLNALVGRLINVGVTASNTEVPILSQVAANTRATADQLRLSSAPLRQFAPVR